MVAKPLYPLYKNIIKPLDRVRYPELRYLIVRNTKSWSNAELKKLTKIVAYDDYTTGAEDDGGTENTPSGGNTNQGAGGETNKDNGGTSQGGSGTSQGTGGGTDSGTDGGGDNVNF